MAAVLEWEATGGLKVGCKCMQRGADGCMCLIKARKPLIAQLFGPIKKGFLEAFTKRGTPFKGTRIGPVDAFGLSNCVAQGESGRGPWSHHRSPPPEINILKRHLTTTTPLHSPHASSRSCLGKTSILAKAVPVEPFPNPGTRTPAREANLIALPLELKQ